MSLTPKSGSHRVVASRRGSVDLSRDWQSKKADASDTMQITIKGKQLDVGDALRAHAETRLQAEVGKYFERPLDANVVFSRQGHLFHIVISVHPMRNIDAQSSAEAEDPYVAFEAALERVSKQLRRYKRRLQEQKQRGADGEAEALSAQQFVLAADDSGLAELEADEQPPLVIAEMETAIPTCSVSGAVMRLDLQDAQAMMFRNSAHGGLNVIYRRPDGNIGWIDPQPDKK
jgi:ribosomal subunit interface protein